MLLKHKKYQICILRLLYHQLFSKNANIANDQSTQLPYKIVYTIYSDGNIAIEGIIETPSKEQVIHHLGLHLEISLGLENINWNGRGLTKITKTVKQVLFW